MYSVIFAAALTTSGATAPTHFWKGCHGCHGCFGVSVSVGWCHGCYGCYGCHGCYGGSWTFSPMPWTTYYGCYGSCYGTYGGPYATCFGCHGCYGCYGGALYQYVPVRPAENLPVKPKDEGAKPGQQTADPYRARLIVELPEDAKLFVDDRPVQTANQTVRTFTTPQLDPSQEYFYILRGEVVRNGQKMEETQRVTIRAGSQIKVNFRELEARIATASAER